MTTPPDIFLSYNREDQARAKLFAEAFEGQGFKVWWDVGLRTGEAYDEVTETALRTAKAVVVLWSKKSVQSRWVRAEATLADRNKTLVPCMIEACERPIMFELTQTAELGHWQGDAKDKGWVSFLGDVRRFVGRKAPVAAPRDAEATPATVQETLKPGQRGEVPSFAVLPFTNRSGSADDDVFAIGFVEDVISALSQGADVRVLGASATAALTKGAIPDLAAVGRQLGVQYLLEGNVRRAGPSLRVTAQLLEAATGTVLWTGKFDRPLSELADLQEELVLDLAASLNVEVFNLEIQRALQKPDDLTVWQMLQRAQYIAYSGDPLINTHQALAVSEQALALAPDYALANAVTASCLTSSLIFRATDEPEAQARAVKLARRALQLAPNDPAVLMWTSHVFLFTGAADQALRQSSLALRKLSGSGMAHFQHALACARLNRAEEGLTHMTAARRLMPGSHLLRLIGFWQGELCRRLGRLSEANDFADEAVSNAQGPITQILKARIAMDAGDEAKAKHHIGIAKRFQIPLARLETVLARFGPVGSEPGQMIGDLRRLWDEAEPEA
jgi:TolB-like protein